MKYLVFFALLFISGMAVGQEPKPVSPALSASEIILAADKFRGGDNWGFNIDVVEFEQTGLDSAKVLSRRGFQVAARLFGEYPDGVFKALVQFTSPQNELGRKMLMDGRIYWMFFPDTKSSIRINPDQRLAGLATAADIASTNFGSDYKGELAGEENVLADEGKEVLCYKLNLSPKHDSVAYGSLVYFVEKENLRPAKAEYYSISGKLLKIAYFRQFKMCPALGGIKSHELCMFDAVTKERVTRILYRDLRIEQRPDYFFRKDRFTTVDLTTSSPTLTPAEIVRNADRYRSADSWGFTLRILDLEKNPGAETKKLSDSTFSGVAKIFGSPTDPIAKCLCSFLEPESEAGKKMLMEGNNYWMFFPNTKRWIEIGQSQRLVGLAAAGDVAGTNFSSYYTAEFASPEEDTVLGKRCYKMILKAKADKQIAYPKLYYWVEQKEFFPMKVEYFSIGDTLLKTVYYRNFKHSPALNRVMAHELFIVDSTVTGSVSRVTRMLYKEFRAENPDESVFRRASGE